jgi:WhiB family redox-sensing transcriptional regulator
LTEWRERAACKGETESFFSHDKNSLDRARALCASCEVRGECLEAALDATDLHGVWAGLTEAQRRVLRRRRAG